MVSKKHYCLNGSEVASGSEPYIEEQLLYNFDWYADHIHTDYIIKSGREVELFSLVSSLKGIGDSDYQHAREFVLGKMARKATNLDKLNQFNSLVLKQIPSLIQKEIENTQGYVWYDHPYALTNRQEEIVAYAFSPYVQYPRVDKVTLKELAKLANQALEIASNTERRFQDFRFEVLDTNETLYYPSKTLTFAFVNRDYLWEWDE